MSYRPFGGIVLKRILQVFCSVSLIAVLMGGSLNTTARETVSEDAPTTQVLASVSTSGRTTELPVSKDMEMAALTSVLAGLGLILVGCSGLFILERS